MILAKLIKSLMGGEVILISLSLGAGAASALSVTGTNNGNTLANTIQGSGVTISNITFVGGSGSPYSAGTFTGGLSSGIGIDQGIILTSGNVNLAPGPNNSNSAGANLGLSGDSNLNVLAGGTTFDATSLEFDFTTTTGNVFFNYVFASEEYNEFVGSQFNDVFGFFLDGNNIAVIPSTNTPVAINNVNLITNSAYYNNNSPGPFNIQYDGFTNVFTASGTGLGSGTHTIKLAIADTSDSIYDSAF